MTGHQRSACRRRSVMGRRGHRESSSGRAATASTRARLSTSRSSSRADITRRASTQRAQPASTPSTRQRAGTGVLMAAPVAAAGRALHPLSGRARALQEHPHRVAHLPDRFVGLQNYRDVLGGLYFARRRREHALVSPCLRCRSGRARRAGGAAAQRSVRRQRRAAGRHDPALGAAGDGGRADLEVDLPR